MALELLPADEIPDSSDDVAPLRCQVEGCQNTLTYSGRGRKPTKCDEHKTQPSTSTGTRSTWRDADQVERQILRYLNGISVGVTWVNPVDGKIIAQGNPAVAHELIELGKVDKQWRKWLDKAAKPGKYGPLFMAMLPTFIGIAGNHNLLPQFRIPTADEIRKGGAE